VTKVKTSTALAPPQADTEPDKLPARRDAKGRFPAGMSGNPAGRAKGTKNRITLARLMLEEVLRESLTAAGPKIMRKAIKMALSGEEKIMRVLLDKMLASPRGDDSADAKDTEVRVIVQNLTSGAPSATKVEAQTVNLRLPAPKEPSK
jgi:hypothetical protein